MIDALRGGITRALIFFEGSLKGLVPEWLR